MCAATQDVVGSIGLSSGSMPPTLPMRRRVDSVTLCDACGAEPAYVRCWRTHPERDVHPIMATTNDLKNGLVLNLDGDLWSVVEFQHVKPGKGGAFVRTTLKNVLSGKVVDRTFNAGTKVDTATVDKRSMQYLYADGEEYVFMDLSTYEQIHVSGATVGDGKNYLLPEAEVVVATHEGVPLYI